MVKVMRETKETKVRVVFSPGEGKYSVSTGVPFFDHMLEQFAKHGSFDLTVEAEGDIDRTKHHVVEDVGITLGQAIYTHVKENQKIHRYGFARIPMDDALSEVVIDISGRPSFVHEIELPHDICEELPLELVVEFFKSLTNEAKLTLHATTIRGVNTHHIVESLFKSFGVALAEALLPGDSVRSTKEVLL